MRIRLTAQSLRGEATHELSCPGNRSGVVMPLMTLAMRLLS